MDSKLFETLIERKNTGSIKWDYTGELYGAKDLLPMWVADMDFPSPEPVQKALIDRIQHPVFGYTAPPAAINDAIQTWMKKRHDWDIKKEWIMFSPGVVSALAVAIQAFTRPGDKVMLQSPVYTPFFDMVTKNEREVVNNQLHIAENRFSIDFTDFEEKLKSGVKLFLLCNPQNPGGRIWTKNELTQIGELCHKYGVPIISDEIHGDLYLPPFKHVPIASIDERFASLTVTLMAPSKTFNVAGLQSALLITENPEFQKKLKTVQDRNAFHGLNLFGLTAMEAAYREGEEWLNELVDYLKSNIEITTDFISRELPEIVCMRPEASYLVWLDCRNLGLTDEDLKKCLIEKGKLALEPGTKYGPGGEGFVRMNIGCPREILLDGLQRLKKSFS
ncbi:pyridoxal phosphate-dependent aminotransferase [Peribacillus cavernae]|uniref:cysteine-S-conjugate beta-lyase n=1 Tax=Peribacillus cavernae TaxID=1674310 RepID=A0A3S0V831_9BACI|nr:MalY/PatB family protein [Peribacillus cavernae]MDQ0219619.1 cystathionine beta-lyase [Peribacillus cavernae]RUQ25906.1 pyridoxal phosphate-dependent aminotransferase [Peribacillus cavernae]